MPNFKRKIANFLFHRIKKHIRINSLTLDSYLDNEAQKRSSIWREKHDDFASAVQQLNDIIFDRDDEIKLLKSQMSGIPTKQQILDKYIQDKIDSGDLTGHNLTEKQIKNEDISRKVLLWWEDAQYMESRSGQNTFDEAPDFVVEAMRLTKDDLEFIDNRDINYKECDKLFNVGDK